MIRLTSLRVQKPREREIDQSANEQNSKKWMSISKREIENERTNEKKTTWKNKNENKNTEN